MCGIIGYCGNRNASDVAIEALERLSYRGYDSAGIAVHASGLYMKKAAGKIATLKDLLADAPLPNSNASIGHTRWATHGEVNDSNSHPHGTERTLIVHNGIIENYSSLRSELEALGYRFKTQTDTEAAAYLIDYNYAKYKSARVAICKACERLRGSYAILAIFADLENEIWCVRHESPLLIGLGDGEIFISSDIPAFLPYTNRYIRLKEDEIALISQSGATVFSKSGYMIECEVEIAAFGYEEAKKCGYAHFMRKEISDEPSIISNLCSLYSDEAHMPSLPIDKEIFLGVTHISLIGCGTAYHAALYGKGVIEKLSGIRCDAYIASEFRYSEPIFDKSELAIFISQSGETADTLSALRMVKAKGYRTLGIVNTVGSSISAEAERTLYIHAGVEIAVASTKAYIAQCVLLAILAADIGTYVGKISENEAKHLMAQIKALSGATDDCIKREGEIISLASELSRAEHIFFIGKGFDYTAVLEASLKLKEISYIHSEAYPAGELKHGTISLITDKTPVIALICDGKVKDKTLSSMLEVTARGAPTFAISPYSDLSQTPLPHFSLPLVSGLLSPIPAATVFQLIAYHVAKIRGCDIDKPRNLAKSVTVE